MCGLFGRFSPNLKIGLQEELCAATNHLIHRGPDDGAWWSDGPFFLGHRRLSIIDVGHGAQPMATVDHRCVIAFNGEIYNYLELRLELEKLGCQFLTNSDTEVILAGYQQWKEGVCAKLEGMFAFAIADRISNSLFLARDRFGEKPLFVSEQEGIVTFGSELGAFNQLSDFNPSIDMEGLGDFLCLNYVTGNRTLIQNVERLPAATWRRYSELGKSEGKFWTPPIKVEEWDIPEALDELQKRIDDSLRICLRSDVPVALFLSGGIDSSILAEAAVRHGRLTDAFCLNIKQDNYGELPNATFVAEKLGLKLHEVPLDECALSSFLEIVEHLDDPLADSSALAVWTLARETSKNYKVVISGDGGDELFGGYQTYSATLVHQALMERAPSSIRRLLSSASHFLPVSTKKVSWSYKLARFLRAADLPSCEAHFSWNGAWLPKEAASFLVSQIHAEHAANSLSKLAQRHQLRNPVTLSQLQYADIAEYLPNDILAKVDRATMAFGLESRAPLLNAGVVEFALSLPESFRLGPHMQTKRLLRLLASRHFGARIGTAKKQGFSIPVHQWLRGAGRERMEDLLSEASLAELPFLSANRTIKAKKDHLEGRFQLGFELWGLMVLVAWYRARILLRGLVRQSSDLHRIHLPKPV